jgi:hypothetical protein
MVVVLVFLGLFIFADTTEQEEVDFLLFMPNSAEELVDKDRAMVQLDNVAKYLLGKNPGPGQIYVYGYTANVVNDIDSVDLSRARAQWVMDELRKRGIARDLFADPVAYGPVDLWGNNVDEEDRLPNRRVRILFEGAVLSPAVVVEPVVPPVAEPVVEFAKPEIIISAGDNGETVNREKVKDKSSSKFPWLILLLLLALAALLFLLSKLKRKTKKEKPVPAKPRVIQSDPPVLVSPVVVAPIIPAPVDDSVTTSEIVVNLDEEIRFRAYELYLLRYGQNEDEINDWYRAVTEVCGRYNASGYQTYQAEGSWWAKKAIVLRKKSKDGG